MQPAVPILTVAMLAGLLAGCGRGSEDPGRSSAAPASTSASAPTPGPPGAADAAALSREAAIRAGRWLHSRVPEGSVIYGTQPVGAREAHGVHRDLPEGRYDEILDLIVAGKGDFLILTEPDLRASRHPLLPLAVDKPIVWHEPRVKPVRVEIRDHGTTVVFRVVRPGGPQPLRSERDIKREVGRIQHSENHMAHGILAMRSERWQIAASEFRYVTLADSANAVAHNNLAWCLLQENRELPRAETHARIAVGLQERPEFLDTLAAILAAQGKTDEAARTRERLQAPGSR